MPNRRVKQTYVHIGPRDIKKRKTTFFYLLENSDWNISSRLNYISFFSFFFFLENWKREMRQPLMIDKPVIKLYKSLHHCYHWTVLDIFTNCRSTRCEKKQKRFENFFSLSLCYLPDAKNELSSQQSAQQSCTPYVQKNIHQISRKITKRSKNELNFET